MLLLTVCLVGLGEALLGALGWSGGPLPDAALTLSLFAAFRRRREGDVTLALGVGLASGLFGTGPWGLKALLCLAACVAAGGWRGREGHVRGLDAGLRSLFILCGLGLLEGIALLVSTGADGFALAGLFGRAVTTAGLVGGLVGLERRRRAEGR